MQKRTVVEALQEELDKNKKIDKKIIKKISADLNIPESEIYGVATFYTQFKNTSNAKFNIEICLGTACFILGAESIIEILKNKLKFDKDNLSQNKLFSLNIVRCLGCCSLAPVMSINGELHGNLDKNKIDRILSELEAKQ